MTIFNSGNCVDFRYIFAKQLQKMNG